MTRAVKERVSPLEQARLGHRVDLESSEVKFSPRDQATLKEILTSKYDCVKNAMFSRPNAERRVFDEAPPIPRPDTSWYHPVMENVSDVGHKQNTGTVLLTANEERALFLQYNYCRYRVMKIKGKIGVGAIKTSDAWEMLKWHRRAEGYRDQIAQTNLALVLAMAKRTRMNEVDFGDLVSEGNMALLRAVDKFDVARGFKFSTYACRAILKAFSRAGVKLSKYRQMFPTDFDPKLERSDYVETRRAEHDDDCADEIKQIIGQNRAELTDIEQEVIEHRFAMGEKAKREPGCTPLTLEQVGRIIGVTKERVRQIQNKALDKLRRSLDTEYLS